MTVDLVDALIRTRALEIAPPGQMFWYTSGTVGPYYINTHFLCGGPVVAAELLACIDLEKETPARLPGQLRRLFRRKYDTDTTYRGVIDLLVETIRASDVAVPDCVSGGERRDWFFSTAVALELDRPHLLLYKDRGMVLDADGAGGSVSGLTTVHVADLVTEASSYTGAWIPAVQACGARMALSVNVVDRGQGGIETIQRAGVPAQALIRIDAALFGRLLDQRAIQPEQYRLLTAYLVDPRGAMKAFLEEHPGFLREALCSDDPKTRERAGRLIAENPYDLHPELLQGVAPEPGR